MEDKRQRHSRGTRQEQWGKETHNFSGLVFLLGSLPSRGSAFKKSQLSFRPGAAGHSVRMARFRRSVATHESNALADFRDVVHHIAFVFHGNIPLETLSFEFVQDGGDIRLTGSIRNVMPVSGE